MRVVVDFDLCQRHGLCTQAAPEVFEITDDGLLDVKIETPDESLRAKLSAAERECPTRAITVED